MRALIVDDKAKAELARIAAHADKHRITKRVLKATMRGEIAPAGEAPGYTCHLTDGFKVVFSLEEQGPTGWCRHLSVSVDGDAYPNVAAVDEIAGLLGFTEPVADCIVWTEPESQAVNVLQPVE